MGEDGYLRLTDFGIAKDLNINEIVNDVAGTRDYIAYEVMLGHNYGL